MTVRPPNQDRSRASWSRVLDAGAQILETEGVGEFTIVRVCDLARVSVATIYARVAGKDDLLLAVYDEVLGRIDREHDGRPVASPDQPPGRVDAAVDDVVRRFLEHATFMRSVILLSGSHTEIRRRGSIWTTELGRRFTTRLGPGHSTVADWSARVDMAYRAVLSATVIHVAYGDRFASERVLSDDDFLSELQSMTRRQLGIAP